MPASANLSYILRLNGWDYKWGDLGCCKNGGGTYAFPVFSKDGGSIPGDAYELLVYDGDMEPGRAEFGVKGGKGVGQRQRPLIRTRRCARHIPDSDLGVGVFWRVAT